MKTKLLIGLVIVVLCGSLFGLPAPQNQRKTAPVKAKPAVKVEAEAAKPPAYILQPRAPLYDPAGRRDPFKDLLGGSQTKERSSAEGPEMSVDDLRLVGIAKYRGKLYALVNGPQGFPYKVTEGDKFSDGFVLKISTDSVTFRKTSEKGLRLPSPRDVVKELNPEER
jgi:Tfp pilus assembly protein PilP